MDELEEREYKFNVSRAGHIGKAIEEEVVTLKESELTEKHIKLLAGELVHHWNKSPVKAREKFLDYLKSTQK